MPAQSQLKSLRLRERLWWVMAIALLGAVSWFYFSGVLKGEWLYYAGGILLLVVAVALYTSYRTDTAYSLVAETANFMSTQEFTSLYERSPIPYVTIDDKGIITECNPASVHLLRGEMNRIIGDNFFAFLLPTEGGRETMLQYKISGGVTITDEEVLLGRLDKQDVWVLLSVYPHHDRRLRMLSLIDITERKLVDTAKSEFVALATHQLRTPIAAIRWNLELLTKNLAAEVESPTGKYMSRIERNVLLMSNLIDDFLNVSKLEMGTFATAAEEFALNDFFNSIFDEFNERITRKNLTLIRPEVGMSRVTTDKRLLHIIVSNLVSNGVKYLTPNGQLQVQFVATVGGVKITISDTGIGIPESEMGQLFTKFYRASNAHTQETEGTGLGLYVVKQSVEKLGGTIEVTSKQNAGTTFTVILPLILT